MDKLEFVIRHIRRQIELYKKLENAHSHSEFDQSSAAYYFGAIHEMEALIEVIEDVQKLGEEDDA